MQVGRAPEQRTASPVNPKDYNVYYVAGPQQKRFLEYFDNPKSCFPLLGSAARYNGNGHIFWIEYRDLDKSRTQLLAQDYIQVSKTDPQADLDAPNTLYRDSKGLKFYWFFSAEDAIRAVRDHILPDEANREKCQVTAAQNWIYRLMDFYSRGNFADIPPDEFAEMEKLTLEMFKVQGISDPGNLVNQLKKRAFTWLVKGSSGKDATGRENYLVTKGALEAALLRMKLREEAICGPITRKYQMIHAALESNRYTDRRILEVADEELCTMSQIVVFRHPGAIYKERTVGPTVAKLDDLINKLTMPYLDPYRTRGIYAGKDLQAIRDGLRNKGMVTPQDLERLAHVRNWIKYDLEKGEMHYRVSERGNSQKFDFQ